MTTLYLVRHGETLDNAAQLMQGQTQGELSDTGIRQAEDLRERFKHEAIDVFMASDLHRAIQTCQVIAAPFRQEVLTTPLLRERDWGDFTGRFIPDLQGLPFPQNVESMEAMRQRAMRFLSDLRTQYPDKTVLAVGHGIINKVIQSVFYAKPMSEIRRMENAEVRILLL